MLFPAVLMLCGTDDFNILMLLIFTTLSVCFGAFRRGDLYPFKNTLKSKNTGLEILGKNSAVPCRKEQL